MSAKAEKLSGIDLANVIQWIEYELSGTSYHESAKRNYLSMALGQLRHDYRLACGAQS